MPRKVLNLPENFKPIKIDFEKLLRLYWNIKKNQGEENTNPETLENLTILYAQITSLLKFFEGHLLITGDKLLEKLNENNTNVVTLPMYGKKLEYDTEASWLFLEDMSQEDWIKFDGEDNEKYLQKYNNKS